MQQAAVALVLTRGPTSRPARQASPIRAHGLYEHGAMPRHPLDVLDEDLQRLTQKARSSLDAVSTTHRRSINMFK
jgi:hypothetical protein